MTTTKQIKQNISPTSVRIAPDNIVSNIDAAINNAIKDAQLRLAHIIGDSAHLKFIGLEDFNALVKIDYDSYDDLCYDDGGTESLEYDDDTEIDGESEFITEMRIPSFYGIILYSQEPRSVRRRKSPTGLSHTLDAKVAVAYAMGHSDNDMDEEGLKISAALEKELKIKGLRKGSVQSGAYLSSIAVLPKFQRIGIFRVLMECFEVMSRAKGLRYMRTHSRTEDNEDGTGDYNAFEKTGFGITGRINDYLDKGDHFYEMVKKLE